MGTDRVFNPADAPLTSSWVLWLGVAAFAGALAVGVYLSVRDGWPILGFALLGGSAAIFYEAPPIRWSYRGLGEVVIALSYGPWMVLGSLYLQSRSLSWTPSGHRCAGPADHGVGRGQRDSRFPPGPSGRQAQPRCGPGRAPSGCIWRWRRSDCWWWSGRHRGCVPEGLSGCASGTAATPHERASRAPHL